MIGRTRLSVIVPAITLWLLWVSPLNLLAQIGIQYGATVSGTLANASSIAMYRFEGEAGDAITIQALADARCQPRLALMNPALNQLAVGDPMPSETEAQISFQLLETAPYYISLNNTNGIPCNFVLTLEGESEAERPTNTPPAAPVVPSSSLISFDVNVSSYQNTVFNQSLPPLTFHQLRLHFVDVVNAHPQTFRITLTCPGNDQIMLEDLRCGDTFTFIPSALEAGLVPVHGINLAISPAFTDAVAYTLTIVPESPLLPIATDDLIPFTISASSSQATVVSQNLPALVIHQLRLNFVDLANAQPQTFRITLTCPGNDQIMLEDLRCGDAFTLAPTASQAGMIPVQVLNLAIPPALTSTIPYTLTIQPESPLLPVATTDNDFLINVPLNTTTTFNQSLSAPLGDAADKITMRVPDLFSGSWDFTLSLLCTGTGTEAVQWSLQTGQVLACGDVITLPLAPLPNVSPIPSLDMFVALAGQPGPAYVAYTLLIIPAGSGLAVGSGTYNFPVALTGESQFLQSLSATMDYHTINISVPELASGSPRQIAFTLTCAGGDVQALKAGMAGVTGELVCGSSFQRSFATASEQAQFVIQLTTANPVSYMLRAAPVYVLVAPPDTNPHSLLLHATEPVILTESISWPEGDYEDRIVLDASQIRSSALPRTYTISLICEGPGTNNLLGELTNGIVLTCGSSLQHTFGTATSSTERGSNQTNLQALPTLPGSRTSSQATTSSATTLPIRLYLPVGTAPGVTSYVLQAVPIEQSAPQTSITVSDFAIQASSTTVTTFTQTLTSAQSHRLQVRFPDLTNAHAQTFRLQLLCTGVGTTAVRALTDWGDTLLCGGSFDRLMQTFSNNPLPGIDFTLDFLQTDLPGSVNYTLRLEPVSPYVPVAPDDSLAEPYPLVLSTTAQTVFTQEISTPLGDQSDRIQATIPGLTGERTFSFLLKCEGASAGAARLEVELPMTNMGQLFHHGLCDVPFPVSIDQSAGGPPSLSIRVEMATTSQPAYAKYTLYITPAGIEPPFTLPQTETPTSTPSPAPTVISTTAPPNLIAPSNNATFDSPPVQLSWSEISGARYEVEIQRCTIQGTNCVTETLLVNTTGHSLPVPSSSQIIWRVRALLPDGSATNFSQSRTFKVFTNEPTATPIPMLVLIGPSNNATFDSQPVELSWSEMPGARYEFEIQRCTIQGTNCVTETLLVNTTSHSLPVPSSSQIIWRVRALLPDGSFTNFTPSRSFKVFLGEATVTPVATLTLIAPADGVSFSAQPVPLNWSALPGASRYEIEIQRCSTEGANCATEAVVTESISFALPVPSSSQINWRVRAILNDGSVTGFTPSRSFKVFLTGPTVTPIPAARATPTQALRR